MDKQITDNQLMEQVILGDSYSFEILYQRHYDFIFRYVFGICKRKEKTQEVVQEAFLRAYQKRALFQKGTSFKAWLGTIARNYAIDTFRKKEEVYLDDKETGNLLEGINEDLEALEKLISHAQANTVRSAMNELPSSQGEALRLWMEDLTYEEMGKIMGKSPQAIKNLVNRGKNTLKKRLEALEE